MVAGAGASPWLAVTSSIVIVSPAAAVADVVETDVTVRSGPAVSRALSLVRKPSSRPTAVPATPPTAGKFGDLVTPATYAALPASTAMACAMSSSLPPRYDEKVSAAAPAVNGSSLATNASVPPRGPWSGLRVGKSVEVVTPATSARPCESMATAWPTSFPLPPR